MWSVLSILLAGQALGQLPGLRLGFTEHGVENFKDQAVPALLKLVPGIPIPNYTTEVGSSFYKITFTFTDFKIPYVNANVQDAVVDFQPDNKIKLNINNIAGQASCNWSFKWLLGSGHGSAALNLSQTGINIEADLFESNGRPHVQIPFADINIGKLDIHIDGDLGVDILNWLIGLLNGVVKGLIEHTLEQEFPKSISQAINGALDTLPLEISLLPVPIEINYKLTESPKVTDTYIDVSSLALFLDKNNPDYNPPIPAPVNIPYFDPEGKDIQIMFSDYSINSALNTIYTTGFNYTILSEIVPDSSPIKIDTTGLEAFFPGLTAKYGAGKKIDIVVKTSANPLIHSHGACEEHPQGKITGVLPGSFSFVVRDVEEAVRLNIASVFNETVYMENWVLKGTIEYLLIDSLTVVETKLDKAIDEQGMKDIFNMLTQGIIPVLNENILGHGIPLPSIPDVVLTDTLVTIEEGYLWIEANPIYNITSLLLSHF
jgi:hypothetical protein